MLPLINDPPPGVSLNFLAAVQWALAVRPQDRPQSVEQFRNALDGRIAAPALRPMADVEPAEVSSPHALDDAVEAEDMADPMEASLPPLVIHEDPALYPHHPVGATWDTTLRMSSTATATLPTVRFPKKGRVSSRVAAAAVVAAFTLVAGTLVSMLRGIPVEADASTWRELARQAPRPEAVRELERLGTPGGLPAPSPLPEGAATLKTVAATSVPAESTQVDVAPPQLVIDVQPSLSTARMQGAKHAAKRASGKPARKAGSSRTKPAPVGSIGPREACSGHNFFTVGFCMSRKCEEPRFRVHAECVAMAQEREQRTRRFGQL
jgi:hypothetical protein